MSKYKSMDDNSRLKDAFYNVSDIIAAAVIIITAALIIAWRVGVIMSYGEASAENTATAASLAEKRTDEYNAAKEPGIYNSSMAASEAKGAQDYTAEPAESEAASAEAVSSEQPSGQAEGSNGTGTDDFSAVQGGTDQQAQPEQAAQPDGSLLSITIYDTDTAVTIAERLQQNGIISDAKAFVDSVVILGTDGSLHAGTFTFKPGVSLEEVINTLSR